MYFPKERKKKKPFALCITVRVFVLHDVDCLFNEMDYCEVS